MGVRPVGSARVNPTNLAATGSSSTYVWADITDAVVAGDTGTQLELYIVTAGTIRVQRVRVDYADSPVVGYFAGNTADDPTHDYGWDGTAYFSPSAVLALGAGDTTPPSAPTGLTAQNVNPTTVQLYWTAATDNVAVTGYNVYEDGNQIATVATTGYQRTGLTPNTSHAYTVTAVDVAGNESAHSAAASGTPPVPANLRQAAFGLGSGNDWNHVELAWDPVTHPLGVKYKLYEGLSLQNDETTTPITETAWTAYTTAAPADDRLTMCCTVTRCRQSTPPGKDRPSGRR